MKRLISKKLIKNISYLLVLALSFGPIANLNAAKVKPTASKKAVIRAKDVSQATTDQAKATSSDSSSTCPAETQQCLTDPNKIANFNELVSAFNDFLTVSASVDSPNLLTQDLQAEPLPAGYAINTTTTNFEIKAAGADASTYNDLSTWFSYTDASGLKKSFFTNPDPTTPTIQKPNTVNCLGFDSLMNSDSIGDLVSNPDDMHKIIFSNSCIPDLYKLQAAQNKLVDSQSRLMNAIYKMNIKDIFYTQKELKDSKYNDLQILLATLTLKQGQTMVTDMKTGVVNVLQTTGSGKDAKTTVVQTISIDSKGKVVVKDGSGKVMNMPDYEKVTFPQMPVKSQTSYGPAGSEVKILNLTNWIPINFDKLNNWINCQANYQNNNASNCQQKVDTPSSSSSWDVKKLADQFGPGFVVSTVLSLGIAYLFLRHSKGAEVKAAKEKTAAEDAKAKEKSAEDAKEKSQSEAEKGAKEKSAADEAGGAKGEAGADAPNVDVNIDAPNLSGGAGVSGAVDISANIPEIGGGAGLSGAPGEGLTGIDVPAETPVEIGPDVPIEI